VGLDFGGLHPSIRRENPSRRIAAAGRKNFLPHFWCIFAVNLL
jgi:hypothetical protein